MNSALPLVSSGATCLVSPPRSIAPGSNASLNSKRWSCKSLILINMASRPSSSLTPFYREFRRILWQRHPGGNALLKAKYKNNGFWRGGLSLRSRSDADPERRQDHLEASQYLLA